MEKAGSSHVSSEELSPGTIQHRLLSLLLMAIELSLHKLRRLSASEKLAHFWRNLSLWLTKIVRKFEPLHVWGRALSSTILEWVLLSDNVPKAQHRLRQSVCFLLPVKAFTKLRSYCLLLSASSQGRCMIGRRSFSFTATATTKQSECVRQGLILQHQRIRKCSTQLSKSALLRQCHNTEQICFADFTILTTT